MSSFNAYLTVNLTKAFEMRVCVCVCVCKWERERQRLSERELL